MGRLQLFLMAVVLLLLTQHSQCFDMKTQMRPVELFSIELTQKNLTQTENYLQGNFLQFTYKLKSSKKDIAHCQMIGTISSINVKRDIGLQFYFTYTLNRDSVAAHIKVYYRSFLDLEFSDELTIVLDFMVAQFPLAYYIQIYNMTDYQEHVMYHLEDRFGYQLLTFVNGFSNISLSGNITHSYNAGGQMFTVHYMTCVGEEAKMGWIEKRDFLLFTFIIAPRANVIQKFYLYNHTFNVENPSNIQYFYGLKGATDDEFSGKFIENYNGVTFQAQSLKPQYSYGISFLPMPSDVEFIDNRIHPDTFKMKIASGITIAGIVVLIGILGGYRLYKNREKSEEQQYLKEVPNTQISSLSKRSRNYGSSDEDTSPTRKQDDARYQISTVPEVQEGLQGSLRGSAKTSKVPSLNDAHGNIGQNKYAKFVDQEGIQQEKENQNSQENEEKYENEGQNIEGYQYQ